MYPNILVTFAPCLQLCVFATSNLVQSIMMYVDICTCYSYVHPAQTCNWWHNYTVNKYRPFEQRHVNLLHTAKEHSGTAMRSFNYSLGWAAFPLTNVSDFE